MCPPSKLWTPSHPQPEGCSRLGGAQGARQGHSQGLLRQLRSAQQSCPPHPRPTPGSRTADFLHAATLTTLFREAPDMPPASSQGGAPFSSPQGHTSWMPWQVLRWKRGGSLLVQGVGYEVRGAGAPRCALGSCSGEAHQERAGRVTRTGWRVGGGETQGGAAGMAPLLGTVICIALAICLALLLRLQVIRA